MGMGSAAILAGLLAGCGGGSNTNNTPSGNTPTSQTQQTTGQPQDGGTITLGTTSDIATFDPIFISDTASSDPAGLIWSNIYDVDRQGNLVVDDWSLAAQPLQISSDGLTYTIKLKPNLKWSDGQPLTADDVVFGLTMLANPDVGSPYQSYMNTFKDAVAQDPQTVVIHTKEVDARFQRNILASNFVLPKHLLSNVKAADLQKNPFGNDPTKTVTNGPYIWKSWTQKQQLELDRNPNYWGPKPHIDTWIYKVYADQNTEVQALKNGDVDVMTGIPIPALPTVQNASNLNISNEPGPAWDYLGFNFKGSNFPSFGNQSPFAGLKTRQAIAMALNRKAIVDQALKGNGRLINGPYELTGNWASTNNGTNWPYDPAKAKQFLADDGWKMGSDGILQKNGHPFEFTLQYNTGNVRREQLASIIQDELKQVGIKVDIQGVDFASWINNNINPGKYQAILLGWQNSIDPDMESIFSSKVGFPPNGQNSGWYVNKEADALWPQAYHTLDQNQRKQIYAQINKILSNDLPYVFLYQQNIINGYTKRVHWSQQDAPEPTLPGGYLYHDQVWWVSQ
ncbi:MAG: peptide ABC transporter substrate-binding protein [Firmicutes bacterium]|nr:peptide ABC transporter substrate-binding protein [Bacillota bacterium]